MLYILYFCNILILASISAFRKKFVGNMLDFIFSFKTLATRTMVTKIKRLANEPSGPRKNNIQTYFTNQKYVPSGLSIAMTESASHFTKSD